MPAQLVELMRHEAIETTLCFDVGTDAQRTADAAWAAFERAKTAVSARAPNTAPNTTEATPTRRPISRIKPREIPGDGASLQVDRAGIERDGYSSANPQIATQPGTESGTVPPGLADLARLLAGMTPEQVQALVTLAQAMTAEPQGAKPQAVAAGLESASTTTASPRPASARGSAILGIVQGATFDHAAASRDGADRPIPQER